MIQDKKPTGYDADLKRRVQEQATDREREPAALPVDSNGWPTKDTSLSVHQREAENVAKRLGHNLTSWLWRKDLGIMQARCLKCAEVAMVRKRAWRGSITGGAALALRCR